MKVVFEVVESEGANPSAWGSLPYPEEYRGKFVRFKGDTLPSIYFIQDDGNGTLYMSEPYLKTVLNAEQSIVVSNVTSDLVTLKNVGMTVDDMIRLRKEGLI